MESNENSDAKILLVAFQQNFEHARHIENLRQQQLYVFIVLFGAVLTFIFSNYIALHLCLQQYWSVFLFLALFSYIISSSFAKWNLEFKSHLRHIQWISEKLKLIKCISPEKIVALERAQAGAKKTNTKKEPDLIKDSMCQGYVALALPLPKQVNQNFEYIIQIIFFGTIFAFVSGFIIYILSFFPYMLIASLPFRIIAYPIGAVIAIIVVILNQKSINKMKQYASKLLDVREPDEITLRYKGHPSFLPKNTEGQESSHES